MSEKGKAFRDGVDRAVHPKFLVSRLMRRGREDEVVPVDHLWRICAFLSACPGAINHNVGTLNLVFAKPRSWSLGGKHLNLGSIAVHFVGCIGVMWPSLGSIRQD